MTKVTSKMVKLAVVLAAIPMTGCVDNLYADMLVAGSSTFAAVIGETLASCVTSLF